VTVTPAHTQAFEDHCRDAVTRLRGSLLEVYRTVNADPARPQEVSRRFGVNRNLAWKVARILKEESALDAVPLIPRPGALDILLSALRKAGAPDASVSEARRAFDEFDHMVEVHFGDRDTLELVLDSMGKGNGAPLEMCRRMAFKSASGLWGLQVAARVTAQFIAPSAEDPEFLDTAQVAGLYRARRFRSVSRWPVFRIGRYTDNTRGDPLSGRIPIDPACTEHPGLMPEFSEGVMPELFMTQRGDGLYYEIGDGPVGKTGQFTCYFGYLNRRFVHRYAKSPDAEASLVSAVTMPAEALHFDLFMHEDLLTGTAPRAEFYGKLWDEGGTFDASALLPFKAEVVDLGRGRRVRSSLVSRYEDLVAQVFERAGWDASRFRCFRLVLEYPPMSSTAAIKIRLQSRADQTPSGNRPG